MIRINEAIQSLKTTPTTFYKRIKKLRIELISKANSSGKASYIREEDLEELRKAMGKSNTTEQRSGESEKTKSESSSNQDAELLQELNELKLEKTTLSSKVEEYFGYLQLYKEQLNRGETKVAELEKQRTELYTQIIKIQVRL